LGVPLGGLHIPVTIYEAELAEDDEEDPIEQGTSKSSFYLI
jgi:hypothetical protein